MSNSEAKRGDSDRINRIFRMKKIGNTRNHPVDPVNPVKNNCLQSCLAVRPEQAERKKKSAASCCRSFLLDLNLSAAVVRTL